MDQLHKDLIKHLHSLCDNGPFIDYEWNDREFQNPKCYFCEKDLSTNNLRTGNLSYSLKKHADDCEYRLACEFLEKLNENYELEDLEESKIR